MTAVDHSFFAADLTVKGSVSGRGRLYVQGRVEGDVTVNQLALTPDGTITGKARADHVVLSGNLIGTLCAHSVTISSTGHLSGLVEYETLGVEPGGTFEAECRPATAPSLAMEPGMRHLRGRLGCALRREGAGIPCSGVLFVQTRLRLNAGPAATTTHAQPRCTGAVAALRPAFETRLIEMDSDPRPAQRVVKGRGRRRFIPSAPAA